MNASGKPVLHWWACTSAVGRTRTDLAKPAKVSWTGNFPRLFQHLGRLLICECFACQVPNLSLYLRQKFGIMPWKSGDPGRRAQQCILCSIQNLVQNPKIKIPRQNPKFGALGASHKELLHIDPKSKIPKIRPKKFGFWILDWGILDFGFQILDFGFRILDFGGAQGMYH